MKYEGEDEGPQSTVKPLDTFAVPTSKDEQIGAAARLQGLWLRHMEYLLSNGIISSTDMATLARVLLHNGWQLDPATLPKNLREKLTKAVGALEDIPEEYGNLKVV